MTSPNSITPTGTAFPLYRNDATPTAGTAGAATF
jgi:hypothetical protein